MNVISVYPGYNSGIARILFLYLRNYVLDYCIV